MSVIFGIAQVIITSECQVCTVQTVAFSVNLPKVAMVGFDTFPRSCIRTAVETGDGLLFCKSSFALLFAIWYVFYSVHPINMLPLAYGVHQINSMVFNKHSLRLSCCVCFNPCYQSLEGLINSMRFVSPNIRNEYHSNLEVIW